MVSSLEYDTAGRPWRRTLGNGLKEERGWDTRGRLSSFALKSAAGATLRSESWGYSSRSDVLSHTVDGGATAYTYDDEGQLLSESRTGYATSYTYDGNGNRKTRVVNGATETYTYDVGDKLESIAYSGGGSRGFTYDLSGRMLTDTLNSRNFAWTADSRLSSLTATTGNETYTYSAFGIRAKVGTRTLLRDGAGVTASVLSDGNASYTPGLSEARGSATTYLHSGIKHTGAQTSSGGSVAATNTYDAFGGVSSSTGSWQGPFGAAGAFGYQTDGSGLHLLGHRYFDSSLGRFLTRDPIGDGSNWYVYCGNDPLAFLDPEGLQYAQPPGLPPVQIPGDDGTRKWKRIPGTDSRPDKWKPNRPVPSQKGGQPSVSWDPKYGQWDLDNGQGDRSRYDSNGTPLPRDNPHRPPKMRPLPTRPGLLIGARAFLMIGLILCPDNLTASPCADMLHAYGRCPRCGKEFGKERQIRFTVPNMME